MNNCKYCAGVDEKGKPISCIICRQKENKKIKKGVKDDNKK